MSLSATSTFPLLNRFPEQPVPMLDKPSGEEIFPNTQSESPLIQPAAISSHPTASYLGEETDTHLVVGSFREE